MQKGAGWLRLDNYIFDFFAIPNQMENSNNVDLIDSFASYDGVILCFSKSNSLQLCYEYAGLMRKEESYRPIQLFQGKVAKIAILFYWPQFRFLTKSSIFRYDLNFLPKFKFLVKFRFFVRNFDYVKKSSTFDLQFPHLAKQKFVFFYQTFENFRITLEFITKISTI